MDNYATHKTSAIRAWLARRPHWHVHLTPTSASWLNQIERFFAELTNQQIRRGVHRSLRELEDAIHRYIDTVNEAPKPFRWTRSADDILGSIQRFCTRTLDAAHQQTIMGTTSESGHWAGRGRSPLGAPLGGFSVTAGRDGADASGGRSPRAS